LITFGFFWNWAVGNGLIGLVAGLTPLVEARLQRAWAAVAAGAIMGAIAIVLGTTFVAATDIWVTNLTGDELVTAEWIPLVTWDLAWGLPLTVLVLSAGRTAERFLKRRS
jgi:energy-coupling factor transport system substrate-specific component